uniref:Uncharacterized protein n=1 Tax=Cacopsylla melanoneura TaxID=428564 RepID=A0A8D8ZQF8_9HEMI
MGKGKIPQEEDEQEKVTLKKIPSKPKVEEKPAPEKKREKIRHLPDDGRLNFPMCKKPYILMERSLKQMFCDNSKNEIDRVLRYSYYAVTIVISFSATLDYWF